MGTKGGSGVFQTIVNCQPPHQTYVEPFCGRCTILRKKAPAQHSVVLDKNPKCIEYIAENYHYSLDAKVGCGIEFLENFNPTDVTCIYLDPPYLEETRTGFSTSKYEHEFTFEDHKRMLIASKNLVSKYPGLVSLLISGYPNKTYDEHLKGWQTFKFPAMTRGGVRIEKLWMSYNLQDIHFHTYAGSNANKRQDIKRKAESWVRKMNSMDPAEKQAVFSALVASMSETNN